MYAIMSSLRTCVPSQKQTTILQGIGLSIDTLAVIAAVATAIIGALAFPGFVPGLSVISPALAMGMILGGSSVAVGLLSLNFMLYMILSCKHTHQLEKTLIDEAFFGKKTH